MAANDSIVFIDLCSTIGLLFSGVKGTIDKGAIDSDLSIYCTTAYGNIVVSYGVLNIACGI
jgi:hypothetical protein